MATCASESKRVGTEESGGENPRFVVIATRCRRHPRLEASLCYCRRNVSVRRPKKFGLPRFVVLHMFSARGWWHACVGPDRGGPSPTSALCFWTGAFGDPQSRAGLAVRGPCHACMPYPPGRPSCKVVGVVHRSLARCRYALLLAAADAAAALLLYKKNTKELRREKKKEQ